MNPKSIAWLLDLLSSSDLRIPASEAENFIEVKEELIALFEESRPIRSRPREGVFRQVKKGELVGGNGAPVDPASPIEPGGERT